ncbi:killer toxin resistant protein [Coemansia javaensis]|uniref:Killer toxin resistant protein n=1 Tax=Coemansia javaensis TaxID=2761396 RepID=A0A9W8H6Z5_9FUNG|nr:killer toxin resistant protein [Coemansia javaensis]
MRILPGGLGALAGLGWAAAAAAPGAAQIRTRLVAAFDAPPLALEIAEAVAAHNSSAFFPFILRLAQNRELLGGSDVAVYGQALAWLEQDALLEPFARSLLRLELAARAHAPAVAAQYQLYGSTVVPGIKAVQRFDDACPVWVQYKDDQACSPGALDELLNVERFYGSTYVKEAKAAPQRLALDHVYPADPRAGAKLVVLYADPRADGFVEFHEHLRRLAEDREIVYVLRYRPWAPDAERTGRALGLAGYGVELVLKSTEYKVIDDRELGADDERAGGGLAEQAPADRDAELLFGGEADAAVRGLSGKQLAALGTQAAQMVVSAGDPLAVLAQLAQGLPQYAHLLAETVVVNGTLAEDVAGAAWRRGQRSRVAINGVEFDEEDMDPFRILEHIRAEDSAIGALEGAGLTQQQALGVLLGKPADGDGDGDDVSDQRGARDAPVVFDMRDASPEKKVVLWFNDLEKDRRYTGWALGIGALKDATRPAAAQRVRKNLVQAVLAADLSQAESWITVFEDVVSSVEFGMPVQLGVVPLVDHATPAAPTPANQMAKAMLYLRRSFKKSTWLSLVKGALITHLRGRRAGAGGSLVDEVRAAYATLAATQKTRDGDVALDWDAVVAAEPQWLAARWQSTVDYCSRLSLSPDAAPAGLAFVNGVQLEIGADSFQQRLFAEFQDHTAWLADQLRAGHLAVDDDVHEFVYGRRALRSRSALVYASDEAPLRILPLGDPPAREWVRAAVRHVPPAAESRVVSTWIVGDFASRHVRSVAVRALAAAAREDTMRVALVHTGRADDEPQGADESQDADEPQDADVPQAIYQLLHAAAAAAADSDPHEQGALASFIAAYLADPEEAVASLAGMGPVGLRLAALVEPDSAMADEAESQTAQNRRVLAALGALPADPSACHVVVNGRLLPQIAPNTPLDEDALVLLARHELQERVRPVVRSLPRTTDHEEHLTQAILATAIVGHSKAALSSASGSIFARRDGARRSDLAEELPRDAATYLELGAPDAARVRIQAVLDPLSEHAQKWTPIFQTLLSLPGVSLELWLNPQPTVKELPVQRFYRYLWPSALAFDASGAVAAPEVVFRGLPPDPLLTLGVDAPPAWLVTATESVHDLDNIRLSSLRGAHKEISATYTLAHILVEGHLVDTRSRAPARGLEVQLGTTLDPAITDTIVMANLGYFQLKAGPGVWKFAIRPGRSSDVYKIDHVGSGRWDYAAARAAGSEAEDTRPLLVTSFRGTTVFPLVSKRAGMESEDVLDDDAKSKAKAGSSSSSDGSGTSGGLWGKIKGSLGGGGGSSSGTAVSRDGRPHFDVFAVASGHLYERLMSIMMLSVLNRTESSVKFWLIESFLSPSFKAFVPHMAEEFGFEYEFVSYKWPHWLHRETEKQRTIWGYKILFLDVLFPLGLDRVIFVDADQIVRADLQELADMDLHGAPYGYTPFCDDRPEIDGFRFWKQGWWKDHLRGKPYHISALYVVDLKRFRQLAAGDRMRGQYQALSRDGGSLANLDQDLPNNMQHIVPIYSLPQEWLWCETWCSDAALKTAKTIDLCNNPMTKEPKLERARRLLPEWTVFDQRVANFSRALAQRGTHSGAHIADAEAVVVDQPPASISSADQHASAATHDEL